MVYIYLGWEKVSCLERCPQFRSVLIERKRFHCSKFVLWLCVCVCVRHILSLSLSLTQDYHWWWRSFSLSGSASYYVMAYAVVYYYTKVSRSCD